MIFIYFSFYIIFSIVYLPLIFLIDIVLTVINRKYPYKYILQKYFLKDFINLNKIKFLIITTSAGELNTIINAFPEILADSLFLYTSDTANEIVNKNKNIKARFMPIDSIFHVFFLFILSRPEKLIIVEHEIWPGYLLMANLFKIKTIYLQAKINLEKLKKTEIYFYKKLFSLFNIIISVDLESYKAFKKYIKNTNIIRSYDLKLSAKKSCEINKKENAIIFASTHKEEEDIFYKSIELLIKKLLDNNDTYFNNSPNKIKTDLNHFKKKKDITGKKFKIKSIDLYFVPRHPERIEKIMVNLKLLIKRIIDIYSLPPDILNLELYSEFQANKYAESTLSYNNNTTIEKNLENIKKKSQKIMSNPFIRIIAGDKFGILNDIYKKTKVCVIGATFAPLGGGHNIMEPLLCKNYVIAGNYLRNLLILYEKFKFKYVFIENQPEKISELILNLIYSYKEFSLKEFINELDNEFKRIKKIIIE